ncbi:MAG: hypothetical protein Tsb002_02960 [Wenzhouxiangellaceae bacterium]
MTPDLFTPDREGSPLSAMPEAGASGFFDRLKRPGLYPLRFQGDSMMDAGIFDGDVVVIAPARRARSGTIVLALVEGSETTLRRFYCRGERITLAPENPVLSPRHYTPDQIEIQGVLYAVLRFMA